MTFETTISIICIIMTLGSYIYLKTTGVLWYGINWSYIFRNIRKLWHCHK